MYLSNKCVSQNQCQLPVIAMGGCGRIFFLIKSLFTILDRGHHPGHHSSQRTVFSSHSSPSTFTWVLGVKLSLQVLPVEPQKHFVSWRPSDYLTLSRCLVPGAPIDWRQRRDSGLMNTLFLMGQTHLNWEGSQVSSQCHPWRSPSKSSRHPWRSEVLQRLMKHLRDRG